MGTIGDTQSGWTAHSTDRTLAQLLGSNTTLPFVNVTSFVPVTGLSSFIPADWGIINMPAIDFYKETRTWPGAPGAVKQE
jgi:hypothetical protein